MANWAKLQEDTIGLPVFKRAKHGIHFQRSDGQIQANFVGKPCHYLDGGLWKPIDTKLLKLPDGFYGCAHSPVRVHTDGRVKVTGSNYAQFTELPGNPIGKVDGDRIIREFAGGYQELFVTEDGFREVITVLKPTFPLEKFIGKSSGALPSAYKASTQTAVDANGDVYVITADRKAFGAWLDKAVYPVVIDPDFAAGTADLNILGISSDFTVARSTSSSYSTEDSWSSLGTEWDSPNFKCRRVYLLFDTSSIGAGSTVTQVNLKCSKKSTVKTNNFDVQIVKYDWSAYVADVTNATNRETAYDGCLTGTADSSILANTSAWADDAYKTSGNLDTTWVNKSGTTYYGLRTSRDYNGDIETNSNYININMRNYTAYRPVLTVTYTVASTAFVNILDHTNSVILGGSIVR